MEETELRNKLTEKFNLFIKDDSKLMELDGIFDSMETTNAAQTSTVPEEHYKIVEQRRNQFHNGETKGTPWEEVKQRLRGKYGV